MNPEILKFCIEKGVLLDKDTFSVLSSLDDEIAKNIILRVSGLREKVLTKAFFQSHPEKIKELIGDEKIVEKIKLNFGLSLEISREKVIEKKEESNRFENLKVVSSHVNLSRKISPGDFVKYFRMRYTEMRPMLMERKELENLTSINKISNERQSISIIAMVFSKRITKNKNIILEVEDLTGKMNVLISQDKKELYEKSKSIIIDDLIGIKGTISSKVGMGKMLFVSDVFYPDSAVKEKNFCEREELVAFTSDIHIGSVNFLEENFLKFIKWINGEVGDEKQREEAKKVKYLLITGDTIDGVGVYPGQEELLTIKDIRKQYEKLAEFLGMIRKDVIIIMCPGQHDSVRVAEPQPPIGRDYAEALHNLDNIIFVSNPALIEIKNKSRNGFKILMYHGASMTPYINEIEHLRIARAHHHPSKVVKEILKRRHLASIHSSVTYIPFDKYDPLIIKEVPDVMNTGDFHRTDVDSYNGVLIICSSCWQSMTPFEEKVGNIPDPCKLPVLNLKTRAVKIIDFTIPEKKEEEKNENS